MQEKNNLLKTHIRYLKDVGPRKSQQLADLGIETVEDLLYYLPARYEDRSNFTKIKDLKAGQYHTIQAEVCVTGSRLTRTRVPVFQVAFTDGEDFVRAVWFNQPYLKDYFRKGQKAILYGKVEKYDKLQFIQPEYEILEKDETDLVHIARIVPIYPLAGGLGQRYLRNLIFSAVSKYYKSLTESLPTYILARDKMVDIRFAVRNIHFPSNFENLKRAYRRIVFEEFFILQLALAIKRRDVKTGSNGPRLKVAGGLLDSFRASLPYNMTQAQENAIADITKDMASGKIMNRLLEGDVGSGKTVVAAFALMLAVQNGFQAVVMAPTEVLARQHLIVLSELLMPQGVNVILLVGGLDAGTKKDVYSEIRDGGANIIVGTHAILQQGIQFNNLGLVIIDEQHKFGVTQRAALKQKSHNPHTLVMTATPIPRTLAMTVYGDLDISLIRELPKGRKPISTYWVEEEKRGEIYNFIKEELVKGRQAYVVCSLIGEAQRTGDDARGAVKVYEKLKKEVFSDYEVGLLHGRMMSKEKDRIMKDFKKGKIKILVSTIVIEVGIDVPNASVMLIENAERFGLAQLHQLRGRVGRGEAESYCILLADPGNSMARQRLKAIEETLDGFQIAEEDLDIRGPGEFFGTRQHGLPEIRFGNILKDIDIMKLAQREAFDLVIRDPYLAEERHLRLKQVLARRFKNRAELGKVA